MGWRHFVHYNSRGTRFHAAGFGPNTTDVRVDCYDNPGDYLASGMDGLEVHVHGNAQDQIGQITKCGKIVIHGDVGQTFLYGAKGGEMYIMGNAAGRPMINAVGRPRVVINGTALDFLAESFMAGNPLTGGGFAIVNGMRFNEQGELVPLDMPYPGSNLLSLASGGAIYVRDPHRTLVDEQTERRRLPSAVGGRLAADRPVPRRERAAVRHPHRPRPVDRRRRSTNTATGLPQSDAEEGRGRRSGNGSFGRVTLVSPDLRTRGQVRITL